MIDDDAIRHTVKTHGGADKAARGQIPVVSEDFERLPDILSLGREIALVSMWKRPMKAGAQGEPNVAADALASGLIRVPRQGESSSLSRNALERPSEQVAGRNFYVNFLRTVARSSTAMPVSPFGGASLRPVAPVAKAGP